MEIVAGKVRGLVLRSPETGEIRPTAVRARRAFFDSLGNLDGIVFVDMCAGSGAMGLEAASRGAKSVIFMEKEKAALSIIRKNCNAVQRVVSDVSFTILNVELPAFSQRIAACPKPDIVFADPPYADSMRILQGVTGSEVFKEWAQDAQMFWELPDSDFQLLPPCAPWRISSIREYGAARFLTLQCQK